MQPDARSRNFLKDAPLNSSFSAHLLAEQGAFLAKATARRVSETEWHLTFKTRPAEDRVSQRATYIQIDRAAPVRLARIQWTPSEAHDYVVTLAD